jgi:hypothetical protein
MLQLILGEAKILRNLVKLQLRLMVRKGAKEPSDGKIIRYGLKNRVLLSVFHY